MFGTNSQNFEVVIEEFAERHFVKNFRKKYKDAWDITERAIIASLARVDNLIGKTTQIEIIHSKREHRIAKLDFSVAGTRLSAKSSGNRAIVYINVNSRVCRLLIIYSKNDICSPDETQKWKNMMKNNYLMIWNIFVK